MKYIYLTTSMIIFFILTLPKANSYTTEEEHWLNSGDEADVSQVNEGKLQFLSKPADKQAFHSVSKLNISQKSITDGWVDLLQCYYNLDKVDRIEITYQYQSIKNLLLVSKKNIESATIANQSAQLVNIKDNAEVCISAEVRIFYKNPDSTFSLINGPYHRRFLDGFYPYNVSLIITYPEKSISFKSSHPEQQDGFSVTKTTNQLIIETYFEGILNTEIIFELNR